MNFRAPNFQPSPRNCDAATEYAEYRAIRDKFKHGLLGRLDPALCASALTTPGDLPYPVKFRNQGALEEWRRLFNAHEWSRLLWDEWATSRSTCLDCINEMLWQIDQYLDPGSRRRAQGGWAEATFANAAKWAANIHFDRQRGALIETTPMLDTLLMHSDIDDTLPMQLFSPPFNAQYLRLHRATAEQFMTGEDRSRQRWIDGLFCFVSKPGSSENRNDFLPVVELVIIYNDNDQRTDVQLIRGPLIDPNETVTQWVNAILTPNDGQRASRNDVFVKLINTMVKVFLYVGLKDARKQTGTEYSTAIQRLSAVGPKKQAKLHRRLDSLYDRITVGPTITSPPSLELDVAAGRAPHWRRGHFRAQAYGPARGLRKLIFVAPILIHADRLDDRAPPPKSYKVTTGHAGRD